MINFKRILFSVIVICGFIAPLYAANPVSKEYVDLQIQDLQSQINNLQPGGTGTTFTAGTGISIIGGVISNSSPGITYTAGSGIGIAGNVITNSSPGITYTAGNGISISGNTISAATGAAEFTRIIQTPNISVPVGTAFTIDTQVTNSVPGSIVISAGDGGSVYTLTPGTYLLDYETSLVAAGTIGIYTGANAGSLVLDPNSVAGSTTATTWIHGRVIEISTGSLVVAVSPVAIAATVTSAGSDVGVFMIRLTILKIA
jgi:hypothetical protein